ncbi:MAG: SpoIIE family protein phosphatase [Thiolinea sp.]
MNILLVDDALDMRLVMKRTLELMGYNITIAEDGGQAWQYLQNGVFHLVITDWEMPNMNGPELCRHIRSAKFPNYIYIILLTGRSGKHNLITGMDAGADDFATKPIERNEMAVLLRAAERVIFLERALEKKNQHLADANKSLKKARDETLCELKNAATLQMGILPSQKHSGALDFAWFFRPAKLIGGDTFNYFPLNDHLYFFYTVDVSGHGISSALLSMYLSNLLTSATDKNDNKWLSGDGTVIRKTLLKMLQSFNAHLLNLSDHYCTMILGVIDTQHEQLYLVQAGHPKPYLINKKAECVEEIDCTGFPVGLLPDVEYEVISTAFRPGNRLVLFSDGWFEIPYQKGQVITSNVLKKALKHSIAAKAEKAVDDVCDYFSIAQNMNNQPDDLSMLMIDFQV